VNKRPDSGAQNLKGPVQETTKIKHEHGNLFRAWHYPGSVTARFDHLRKQGLFAQLLQNHKEDRVDLQKLFNARYLCILPVAFSLLGSLLMFLIGVFKTFQAFTVFFAGVAAPSPKNSSSVYEAAVILIRSVDAFLIGLFLIVFSYSTYALFLKGQTTEREQGPFSWLRMDGLDQLKTALAQLVIVILFVQFLDRMMASEVVALGFQDLVLPIAILCLSAAKRLLRRE
jgi:uncharacterized membrane protein YqhA